MPEGEFPKSDGQYLFASEANRFAGAGRLIFGGSTLDLGSATAEQVTGSFLIGAGSLTNFASLIYSWIYPLDGRMRLRISGASSNAELIINSGGNPTVGTRNHYFGHAILGSPGSGNLQIAKIAGEVIDSTPGTESLVEFSNFPGTQEFVLFIDAVSAGSQGALEAKCDSVNIQAFRGVMSGT